MSRPIEVVPINPHIGAEIRGVDLTGPLGDEAFRMIHDALTEHEVLVFPDQNITPAQQIAFGRRFGELSIHPFSPNLPEMPELIVLDNDRSNPPRLTDVWHSDESFRAEPPMGTILRAVITPDIGGDTLFASMSAAYEGLSDGWRRFISGLEVAAPYSGILGQPFCSALCGARLLSAAAAYGADHHQGRPAGRRNRRGGTVCGVTKGDGCIGEHGAQRRRSASGPSVRAELIEATAERVKKFPNIDRRQDSGCGIVSSQKRTRLHISLPSD